MKQKSLSWEDIVKNNDGTYHRIKAIAGEKIKKNKYSNKKVILDGVKYDSIIELYMHNLIKNHSIPHRFKPVYVLQDKFKYLGTAIREIRMEPDFIILSQGDDMHSYPIAMIDTKGMITNEWKMKLKILKKKWLEGGGQIPIFLPKSKAECHTVLIKIKSMLNKVS